jgi:hypothetical protein
MLVIHRESRRWERQILAILDERRAYAATHARAISGNQP